MQQATARMPNWLTLWNGLVWSCLLICWAGTARAETLQAPVGGRPFGTGTARVICTIPGDGWVLDTSRQRVRPPISDDAIGKVTEVKIAATLSGCSSPTATLRLVATARWPAIEPGSVVLSPDISTVEVRGRRLTGALVGWRTEAGTGSDICQVPRLEANAEHCTFKVGRGISADPNAQVLTWAPAGGKIGSDVVTFDLDGQVAPPATFQLHPARVVLTGLLPPDSAIDLSEARGEVQLSHPEVIRSVECAPARCNVAGGKLIVRQLSSEVGSLDVKFGLLPKVVLLKPDGTEGKPTAHLAVLHCPMSVVSGPPLRGLDSARMVVRIEGRCANSINNFVFETEASQLKVVTTQGDATGVFVLLHLGRVDSDHIQVTASQARDDVVVAVTHVATRLPPAVRVSLEIPGHRNLDFIPNNRPAIAHFPSVEPPGRLVIVPQEGVYHVGSGPEQTVTGDKNAAGLATLRVAYRVDGLPGELKNADLGILSDPLQRGVREAATPASIGISAQSPTPLVEFLCGPVGALQRVMPGLTSHLPFRQRDDCRIVFHRERLPAKFGTQKLNLSIEVSNADGAVRPEGRVSQTIVLRSGETPVIAWIRGVMQPYDRVIVRLSHAPDETHYVGALEINTGAPEVMWTAIFGRGRARLYATTAVPTGLYRFGDSRYSGLMSLNFGVVSRLTWLDSDGREGFLGLEAGVMVLGISADKSSTGQSLTQVGTVTGLGLSVPIANRAAPTQASINLHGWVEFAVLNGDKDRVAFIFGPSISIGNVGTNL